MLLRILTPVSLACIILWLQVRVTQHSSERVLAAFLKSEQFFSYKEALRLEGWLFC